MSYTMSHQGTSQAVSYKGKKVCHAGIKHLGSQPATAELHPVMLVGGRLISQHTNGSLESVILDTHKALEVTPDH